VESAGGYGALMQRVSVAETPLLMGDRVAGLLLRYAALLGRTASADTVRVSVLDGDGDPGQALLLLNGASRLVSQSTGSSLREPDNAEAEAYLQRRIDGYAWVESPLFGLPPDAG
jgi:hypothetical protein